jgi:isopropylmalate/isohomocitrate dehydrogenase-like protein
MYKIAVAPGDGIGKEVIPEAVRVLESTGLSFSFTPVEVGFETWKKMGETVPESSLDLIKRNQVLLFGATTTPIGVQNYSSAILTLRKKLNVYANIRPIKSLPVLGSQPDVDLVVVRENTEGMYSGIEYASNDSAFTIRVITREASERIARKAFQVAETRRGRLCIVTKANIMRATCGLFRDSCYTVAEEYPDVYVDELFIDVAAMNMVMKPQSFDVIVTSNLFGDILSDAAAGAVGGLGLAPSANIGENFGLFEPVHGSAPDIVGKGIANPVAAVLSAGLMLGYLGEREWANRLDRAVYATLEEAKVLTPDLGGNSTTLEVTDRIIKKMYD